ncbi:MAG: hypothetical protein RLZZ292_1217 [Bacteroidota bacterium]|jgi:predicted dienelactone hydrolase
MKKNIALLLYLFLSTPTLFAQYAIGTQTVTYLDPARSNRSIQTYLYYPANAAGSGVAAASGAFPVVVLGHGFTMDYSSYVLYANALVPLGYIVAIPNTETGFSPSHSAFGLDLAFVVSKLYSENTNVSALFYQHILAKSAIMGHSMGGGATYLASASNANVTTTVSFAEAETTPSATAAAANVTVPSLVFSGASDCVAPPATNQTLVYNALPSCKQLVSIVGGGHCKFASNNTNCNFGEMTCAPGGTALAAATQQSIVFNLITPWLNRFLKDDLSATTTYNTTLNNYVTASQVTTLQQNCLAVLPIETVDLRAEKIGKTIQIATTIRDASNLEKLELEKSIDGEKFYFLSQKNLFSIENTLHEYFFEDKNPFSDWNYYCLKSTQKDGSVTYSKTVALQNTTTRNETLLLYPNPVQTHLTIKMDAIFLENTAIFQIFNNQGQNINLPFIASDTEITFDTQSLPEGIYWLKVGMEGKCFIKSLP